MVKHILICDKVAPNYQRATQHMFDSKSWSNNINLYETKKLMSNSKYRINLSNNGHQPSNNNHKQ